jgi:hypothetical protein
MTILGAFQTPHTHTNKYTRLIVSVDRSFKLLLAFGSTVIPGFSLLEIYDQDFYFLLDMYVLLNGSSYSTKEVSVFPCRRYACCTVVSGRVYPRCHCVQVTIASVYPLSQQSQIKSYVRTNGQSASLSWCQALSGTQDQVCITVRQLRLCWCVAPPLTRERVYHLQMLLVLRAVILRSESCGTLDRILLSQIRDFYNPESQVPVFISPRNRVAQLYPRHCVPFSSPPTTRKATVEVLESSSRRVWQARESQSYFAPGGLLPINSSWHQTPWRARPDIFSTVPLRS